MTPTPLRCKMRRGQNGFTLAELLMAMSVCALLGTGVLSLLGGTGCRTALAERPDDQAAKQCVLKAVAEGEADDATLLLNKMKPRMLSRGGA